MGKQEGKFVPATEFKQRCLPLIEEVAETRVPLTVTKHGRPVVRVVPIDGLARTMMGSVRLVAEEPEAYYSAGDVWAVEKPDR